MLRITTKESQDCLILQLEGKLAGPWVGELRDCWQSNHKEEIMLVLSRKPGETILVPDCGVAVTVVAINGNRVRLGISAPENVDI